jgi:Mg-chelatase subunit ChlD
LADSPKVLFVLDSSGSMNAQMEGKAKMEVARKVM